MPKGLPMKGRRMSRDKYGATRFTPSVKTMRDSEKKLMRGQERPNPQARVKKKK